MNNKDVQKKFLSLVVLWTGLIMFGMGLTPPPQVGAGLVVQVIVLGSVLIGFGIQLMINNNR